MEKEKETIENNNSSKEETKVKEDWNFDFTEYETEDDSEVTELTAFVDKSLPKITGFRSKYSTGEQTLNLLVELKRNITKFSIEVGSRQADVNTLWRYYALLDELWEQIRYTFGTLLCDQMRAIKKRARYLLENCQNSNSQPTKELYNVLLYWRSRIYKVFQFANFGYEVEKFSRNQFQRSKRKIVE